MPYNIFCTKYCFIIDLANCIVQIELLQIVLILLKGLQIKE